LWQYIAGGTKSEEKRLREKKREKKAKKRKENDRRDYEKSIGTIRSDFNCTKTKRK
jgi:hypothetical protein